MTEQDIHAHAVALWDELSELIASGKEDIGADALKLFERKIKQVADEADHQGYNA